MASSAEWPVAWHPARNAGREAIPQPYGSVSWVANRIVASILPMGGKEECCFECPHPVPPHLRLDNNGCAHPGSVPQPRLSFGFWNPQPRPPTGRRGRASPSGSCAGTSPGCRITGGPLGLAVHRLETALASRQTQPIALPTIFAEFLKEKRGLPLW